MIPLLCLVVGHTFFVSSTGNDAADGRSMGHAWRSLARVSKEPFRAGDTVTLAGGETFEGNLVLAHPVVVRSSGNPATIHAASGPGITIKAGGIEVRGLVLKGETAGKKGGDGILLAAPAAKRSPHVRIERVDISGFNGAGISMTGERGSLNGFDDVRIAHAKIHGNQDTGIITADGVAADNKGFAHRGLVITDCDVSDNLGGNGIILSGVDGATVEFTRAANNRSPKQGLGMWAWCAKRVTFRYCIASGTRATGDGGGFDLDGGTVDCVVDHCLSFDNDGCGYMHCDFPSAPRTQRNVMRDSISLNDGRLSKGDASGFGFVVWGSGLYDCRIERNLVIATVDGSKESGNGLLFATFIRDDKEPLAAQRLEGALFLNNQVVLNGKGPALVQDNFPPDVKREVTYQGNLYKSSATPVFVMGPKGEKRIESVEVWRTATGDKPGPVVAKTIPTMEEVSKLSPRDLPAFFKRLGRG
ncbi:hypothetical protein BH11ARM2_BH11ARM2_39020 [soil metagenome]